MFKMPIAYLIIGALVFLAPSLLAIYVIIRESVRKKRAARRSGGGEGE